MKKIYLLTLSIFVSIGVWAQKNVSMNAANEKLTKASTQESSITPKTNSRQAPFDVIWSQDFGTTATGGIPSGWTQAGTNQVWKKTFIGSTGYFGSAANTLNSTTKTNGVLIFDADSTNKAITADPTGAAYTAKSGEVISDVIDLTGKPNVRLEFQQYFRLCCSPTTTFLTVSVSGDGGTSWTDYDAKGATGINTYSANPEKVSFNISAIAGGSGTVKVKFKFDSGTGVYFWQIDDIQIIEGPVNDLKLERVYTDFGYTDGGYYTQTPVSQVAPITFRGAVLNDGFVAQTSVNMNVSITGAATYSQASNMIASLPLYGRDTLAIPAPGFTPALVGLYTAVYSVSQTETDELLSNNSMTRTFKVSDTIYARDKGLIGTGLTSSLSPSDYVGGDVDGSVIATLYEFPAATIITSASAYIATTTQNGASCDFVLYNIDGSGNFAEVAATDIYDVTGNTNKGKWVTLPFSAGPYSVTAGDSYVIGVRVYGAPAFDLDILNDLSLEGVQPSQTTFVDAGGGGTWGWIQKAPFIHLNVVAVDAGINENNGQNAILKQNIPNPALENTSINFELVKANTVSLSVYDVTGKLMKTINEGNLSLGMHTINVETATLDAGVYFYTLTVGDEQMTKKMTVMKN